MHPNSLKNLVPWQPGTSPNPGGRPKDRDLVNHILRETNGGRELGEILIAIARNVRYKAADRVRAIELMLDRCYGRVSLSERAGMLEALTDGAGAHVHFHVGFGDPDAACVEIQATQVEDAQEANSVDSQIEAGADATHNEVEALDSPALDAPVSEDRRA